MNFKKNMTMGIALVVMATLSFSFSAQAQKKTDTPLKIAVVDIVFVRKNAVARTNINEQLLKIQSQINSELQAEEKVLREANAQLARKRTLLGPDAFASERKKYEQSVVAYQGKRQNSQKRMNQKVIEATQKLNGKIAEIIDRYAQENKVTLVLERSKTMLASEAYNISDYVLKTLNKELPVVTISPPAK